MSIAIMPDETIMLLKESNDEDANIEININETMENNVEEINIDDNILKICRLKILATFMVNSIINTYYIGVEYIIIYVILNIFLISGIFIKDKMSIALYMITNYIYIIFHSYIITNCVYILINFHIEYDSIIWYILFPCICIINDILSCIYCNNYLKMLNMLNYYE